MRNDQYDEDELVMLCTHLIYVNRETLTDYLFNESIVRGAAMTQDSNGNKILVYPISRTDLPGQPNEFAVITTKYANIDGKVRWIDYYCPSFIGSIYYLGKEFDEYFISQISTNSDFEVQFFAHNDELIDKQRLEILQMNKLNVFYFNARTYEGLNDIFFRLCKLLTTKNNHQKAKLSNEARLEILKRYWRQSLIIFFYLYNSYAFFILFTWTKTEILSPSQICLYTIYSLLLVPGAYTFIFSIAFVTTCCCQEYEESNFDIGICNRELPDGIVRKIFIVLYFLLSISAVTFDFVSLDLSITHADGYAMMHIIALSIATIIPLALFLWRCCSDHLAQLKEQKQTRNDVLEKRKFRPVNRGKHEDKNLLVQQDEEASQSRR